MRAWRLADTCTGCGGGRGRALELALTLALTLALARLPTLSPALVGESSGTPSSHPKKALRVAAISGVTCTAAAAERIELMSMTPIGISSAA
jgi:hypothetical protein